VNHALKIPTEIHGETIATFYLLSLSVPIIISTSGLRGVLEAYQRFDLTTYVRIPMGIMTFAGPLLVLPFTQSVFWITAVLVIARFLAWLAHIWLCFKVVPTLKGTSHLNKELVKPLMRFGGWMTVSNIISPLMVSADRFIIGSMVSVRAVSYYSTPWEVVTKFLLIPASIVGVLFPAFSTTFSQDQSRTHELYNRSIKYVFLILLPVTLLTILLAKPGMALWLGVNFAENSYRVMQILSVGIFFNGMAYLPFGLIQGIGRPDVTAKLHLLEIVFYFPCIFVLVKWWGIAGAAMAWSLRAGLDAILLYWVTIRLLKKNNSVS
jgi:O-antigen/teichoic acid export membrane protein